MATLLFIGIISMTMTGCVSSLHSSDAETRVRAVDNVSDEDALFFIAMDIGVGLKGKWPEMYNETHLRDGEYAEDVRVAAIKRITDPAKLLRCASWRDGDIYRAPEIDQGRFVFEGETYYVHESESRLQHAVHPGDVVRAAALERLSRPECFDRVIYLLGSFRQDDHRSNQSKSLRGTLFPGKEQYSVGCKENAFVDYYGGVKKSNPLDITLKAIVERQTDQRLLCAFIATARENATRVYPTAVECALGKIDGSDARAVHDAFKSLFMTELGKSPALPVLWMWRLLDAIENPTEEELLCAAMIGYGADNKVSDRDKSEIDTIAVKRFKSDTWAECYLNDYFAGYPKGRMIKNITDSDVATRFLIKVRKISVDDVTPAFATITNAEALARIEKECYLKIIAEKAKSRRFELTYKIQYEEIKKITDVINKAIASMNYCEMMNESDVAQSEKDRIVPVLMEWMKNGVKWLMKEPDSRAVKTFSLNGYYAGMPVEHAKLLYGVNSPNADIKWTADKDGKIVRIDFGTTYLASVYKYDAQTWHEWINCFSREANRPFKATTLSDEKKPIGGRGTIVRVTQPIWRHQDGRADLTLTYFGEKKIKEIESSSSGFVESLFKVARGVTGGEVVKEVVLEGARHWAAEEWDRDVGGPVGTLRLEMGTVGPGGTRVIRQPSGKTGVDRTADTIKDTYHAVRDAYHAVEGFLK